MSDITVLWQASRLNGRLRPDFKTIADFRKDNGSAIRNVCRQFVRMPSWLAPRAGDQLSLGVLFERYRPRLYGLAVSIFGYRAEAEDAVHDTFVTAIACLGELSDPAARTSCGRTASTTLGQWWRSRIFWRDNRAQSGRPARESLRPPASQAFSWHSP